MRQLAGTTSLILMSAALAAAHPHFGKTVAVKLPSGVEVTITYGTVPANETHAAKQPPGQFVFVNNRPMLKLSGELQAGSVTLAAGDYAIGVIKNGENDWTLALYPGRLERGQTPDPAKVLKLESMYEASAGKADHMLLDITPGHGKFEGKAVLTFHFGSMFLAGSLG